jgi:hypothetical protein
MNLVFGRVPKEFEGDGEHFIGLSAEGEQAEFFFRLEMEEEGDGNGMIRISDTAGRYMPIDFDNLDELTTILKDIQEYRHDRNHFATYWAGRFGLPIKKD